MRMVPADLCQYSQQQTRRAWTSIAPPGSVSANPALLAEVEGSRLAAWRSQAWWNAVGVIAERGADGELQHARQHGLVH